MFTKIKSSPEDAAKDDFKDFIGLNDSKTETDWYSVLIQNCMYFREIARDCNWIMAYMQAGYELVGTHWAEELMSKEKAAED